MDTNYDLSRLCLFTGTVHYHRLNRKCLLTDGAKYLAKSAGAFWLIDAAASYLLELGTDDWFVQVVLKITGSSAVLTLEDGNGGIRARQEIPYTDFPIPHYTLYACWNGEYWVVMLPSEY